MTLRLYRALIRLLPRRVRERDGEEISRTLSDQLANSRDPRATTWRAIRRFPVVLALEWRDALLAGRIPAPLPTARGSHMEALTRMVRQGARGLARTPAFSLSVILLLGLGVGSVSAMFAVVDHVLLRGMPYPSAERLFVVENGSHSMPGFQDMQSMPSVEAWAASTVSEGNLTGTGDPLRVRESIVTDGFFGMFDGRAELGRLFAASDFVSAGTAVLSYGAWVRLFGGDTAIVGRTIHVNDRALTVIGVLAGDFAVPDAIADEATDIWTPVDPAGSYMKARDHWAFSVAGRMRPGTTLKQVGQEAARVASERARIFPDVYVSDGTVMDLPVVSLHAATTGDVRQTLVTLFGAVVLLLIVACANVTHLFLARGVTRMREMAVRRALGARTSTLVAQMFVESMMLGGAGVLVGSVLAFGGLRAFLAFMPRGLPRTGAIAIDARVFAFAAIVGVATAVLFGLIPALRLTRAGGADPLRSSSRSVTGGRRAHAVRYAIVVAEVAVSLVLVVQAGWLLRSFVRMNAQELGFRTSGIVTMPMSITGIEEAAEWNVRMQATRESIARISGVRDVAFGLTMPLEWTGGGRCCWGQRVNFTGKEPQQRSSAFHPVTENYFRMYDIRIVAGTDWTESRARAVPGPAVINEDLATEMFGTAHAALGATLTVNSKPFEVVGVAANNRHYGADRPFGTAVYMPVTSIPYSPGRVMIAVRTDRADDALANDLRTAIWRTEPKLPVPVIRTMEEWSHAAAARRRFDSYLFGAFSAVALLLVAGGLAGTLWYMVNLQRRSMGIRLALGATPRGLERRVLTSGTGMAAIGAVFGGVGAWFAGRLIESRLYGVNARDLRTLAVCVGVVMIVALISSWAPARRAAGTNPMESLRAD